MAKPPIGPHHRYAIEHREFAAAVRSAIASIPPGEAPGVLRISRRLQDTVLRSGPEAWSLHELGPPGEAREPMSQEGLERWVSEGRPEGWLYLFGLPTETEDHAGWSLESDRAR